MTWTPLPKPEQRTAMVTVNHFGARRRKVVYRAVVAQRTEDAEHVFGGKWASPDTWVRCQHNHLKTDPAIQCAKRMANELNKEDTDADVQ
jgi:hypothetical protein